VIKGNGKCRSRCWVQWCCRLDRGYNRGHTLRSRRRGKRHSCVRSSRSEPPLVEVKAGWCLRLAFRLPIYLYRLDLGWLLGHRGLLLIHREHESGLLRETLLEMILYNSATGQSVVLSAWGEKSDWYRNVGATPALEVRTGGQRYVPDQRFLVPGENHAVLADYRRRHPPAFRVFIKRARFRLPPKGVGG
jgi:deazaflavin-dependent oxidoreductase (nitroreductase family)